MIWNTTRRLAVGVFAAVLMAAAMAQPATADFGIARAGVTLTGPDGTFARQAGSHPDLTFRADFPSTLTAGGALTPDGTVRDLSLGLPAGMVGEPTGIETCTEQELVPPGSAGAASPVCPLASQIGVVKVFSTQGSNAVPRIVAPLFNLAHDDDVPALFGFNYGGAAVKIVPSVRPGDYGLSTGSTAISEAFTIFALQVTVWGVPADSSHNADRVDPFTFQSPIASPARRVPFLTLPTSCPGAPAQFSVAADSWQAPGVFSSVDLTADPDGTPFVMTGCDRLRFDPTLDVRPLSRAADSPSGLDVDLGVPQSDAPDGLAAAHLRRAVVTLPQGMSVSPSSAAGLGACPLAQVKLGSNDPATCPDSSKIGTVSIDTPLLDRPLDGDVVLASQDDNPFHSLLALYLVVPGPGFVLKLPGRVDADERTGQLTTTFDTTPQLPFTRMHLQFRGGSLAPLATPPTCGVYTTHATLTSWASDRSVQLDSPMTIDQNCSPRILSPSVSAGVANPAAGASSPFSFTVTRTDGSQYLSRLNATLPPGLLARIGSVTRCGDADAAAGSCPASSLIGSTSVLSGPGAQPLPLSGRVYLTGPYAGAPFGLSIVVPTAGQAGPFDLGNVVVRARILVDRTDAHVTVLSDPLPTIIRGFPLRLRQVTVTVDRPGFMINPTSCDTASVLAGIDGTDGATVVVPVRFDVLGCSALELRQRLGITLTGRGTTDGSHPGIKAHLSAPLGSANLADVTVTLPLSLALDEENAAGLCTPTQRVALRCPASSIVGQATAQSVLPDALRGPVYFVEGLRKSASGRIIRTLPKLWIPLSADGVTIDVNADTDVDVRQRLVTRFRSLPDAPIDSFDLSLNGGKHGIVVVSGKPSACLRDRAADARYQGQNGDVVDTVTTLDIQGCRPRIAKATTSRSSVTLRLADLRPGKVTVSGSGLQRTTRSIKRSTTATIVVPVTRAARAAAKAHKTMRLKLVVRVQATGQKASSISARVTLRR